MPERRSQCNGYSVPLEQRRDSHVGDVDDLFVAEAGGSEIDALLLPKLEVLAAGLARKKGSEEVLHDPHLLVLQIQPIYASCAIA